MPLLLDIKCYASPVSRQITYSVARANAPVAPPCCVSFSRVLCSVPFILDFLGLSCYDTVKLFEARHNIVRAFLFKAVEKDRDETKREQEKIASELHGLTSEHEVRAANGKC